MDAKKITLEEMDALSMNGYTRDEVKMITKVPGGWIYSFFDNKVMKQIVSSVFVPEENIELIEEEKIFHKDWVVVFTDKNQNPKSKHFKFNDENHKMNWEKKWIDYGNHITGSYKADSLGNIIEN